MTLKKYLTFVLLIVFLLSVPIVYSTELANKTWASYPLYTSPSNTISDLSGNANHLNSQNCVANTEADSKTKHGKYSSSRILHESYVYNASALPNNSNVLGGSQHTLPTSLTACLGINKQIQNIVADLPNENALTINDFSLAFEGWIYPDEEHLNTTSAGQNIMYAKDSFRIYAIEDNLLVSIRFHESGVGFSTETFNLGEILLYNQWQHLAVSVEFIDEPGLGSNTMNINAYINGKAVPPLTRNIGGADTIANRGINTYSFCAYKPHGNGRTPDWYDSVIEWISSCTDNTFDNNVNNRRYSSHILPPVSFFSPDTAARGEFNDAQAWSGNFSHFSVFNESISAEDVKTLYFFGEGCNYPYNCTIEFSADFGFETGDQIPAFLNEIDKRTVILIGQQNSNVSVNLSINNASIITLNLIANTTTKLDLIKYQIDFIDNTTNYITFSHGDFEIKTHFVSVDVYIEDPLEVTWAFGEGDTIPINVFDVDIVNPYDFDVSVNLTADGGNYTVGSNSVPFFLVGIKNSNYVKFNTVNTLTFITNVKNYSRTFIPIQEIAPIFTLDTEIDRLNYDFRNDIKGVIPNVFRCRIEVFQDNAQPPADSSRTYNEYYDNCLTGAKPITFNRGGNKRVKLTVFSDQADLAAQTVVAEATMLVNLPFYLTFYQSGKRIIDYDLSSDGIIFTAIDDAGGRYITDQKLEGFGNKTYYFKKSNIKHNFSVIIDEWTIGELPTFIDANGTIILEIRDLESKLLLPVSEVILTVTNLQDNSKHTFNFNDNTYFLPNNYKAGDKLNFRITRFGFSGVNVFTVGNTSIQRVQLYLTDNSKTEIRGFKVENPSGVGIEGIETDFYLYNFGDETYDLIDSRITNQDGIVTYQVIPSTEQYRLCATYEDREPLCPEYIFYPLADDRLTKRIRFLAEYDLNISVTRPIYSTQIRSMYNDSENKVREIDVTFNFDSNGYNVSDYCVAIGKTSGNLTNFSAVNGVVFNNMNYCGNSSYSFFISSNTDGELTNYSFNADFYYTYNGDNVLYVERKQIKFDSGLEIALQKLKNNGIFEVVFILIVFGGFGFLFFDSNFSLTFTITMYLGILLMLFLIQGYFLSSFINLGTWSILVFSAVAYYMGKEGDT